MRIGIDIRPLQDGNSTRGIGAYLSNLLPELINIGSDNQFIFIAYKNKNLPVGLNSNNARIKEIEEPKYSKLGRLIKSNQPLELDDYKLDVFLQTDFQNPVIKGHTPVVAVAYDLIPLHFKKQEFFGTPGGLKPPQKAKTRLVNLARYRKYTADLKNYSKADRVIAISRATAEDFKHTINLSKPIDVVLLAPSVIAVKIDQKPPKNYLLYVGANEDRKNIKFLIRAFSELSRKNPQLKLKLAGHNFGDHNNPHTKEQEAFSKSLGVKDKVEFIGFVSESEKKRLFSYAAVFAFPSLYEGFGMPVLEAMSYGCPVVAFNNSSIPEVAGKAALLANGEKDFIEGVNRLLRDSKLRDKNIRAGLEHAKKFNWHKTAIETLKVLKVATQGKQV